MADNSKQGFLNSLFQWTVKNTSAEDGNSTATTTSDVTSMNEENKKWLNEALDNLTVNPIERIKLCISKIKDSQTTDEQKREFLEELCHWTEELDLAKDFFTVGGLEILSPLLDHNDENIRIKTCSLLATLVQNNDHCQRIIVQSGLQQKLLKIFNETDNPEVKTKAVTAISALIRGYTLGQLQLQKYQGPKILVRALSTPIPRLQNKLCFLINTICSASPHMKKIFYENGALEELLRLYNHEGCSDPQHVLETIITLSSIKPDSISTIAQRDSNLIEQFHEKLNQRRQDIQSSEDHQEEMNLINQVRTMIYETSDKNSSQPTNVSENQQIVPKSE